MLPNDSTTNQTPNTDHETKEPTREHTALSSAERMALAVIARLALRQQLTRDMINADEGRGLHWLMEDIAEAIRLALPDVDAMEVQRYMAGQDADGLPVTTE